MADKKISQLTGATTPLAGTEVLPIVQGGNTVKVSVSNLTAGRTVSMDSLAVGAPTPATKFTVNSNAAGLVANFTDGAAQGLVLATGAGYFGFYNPNYGSITFRDGANGSNYLTVTDVGNVVVNQQNLVIGTAGKGIDFSANANAPGMTSELLNWYEEGTFTPTFTGFTVGNGSVFGFYRRIGKQVFVTFGFILGSTSAVGSLTGLSGLPFTTGTVGGSRFFNATGIAFKQGVGEFPAYQSLYSASTSGAGPLSTNTNAGMNATSPFTWAADDSLSMTATYFVD